MNLRKPVCLYMFKGHRIFKIVLVNLNSAGRRFRAGVQMDYFQWYLGAGGGTKIPLVPVEGPPLGQAGAQVAAKKAHL